MNTFNDFGFGKLYLEQTLGNDKLVMFVCTNITGIDKFLFVMDEHDFKKFIVIPISIEDLCKYLNGKIKFESLINTESVIVSLFKHGIYSVASIKKFNQYAYVCKELNIFPAEWSIETYIKSLKEM